MLTSRSRFAVAFLAAAASLASAPARASTHVWNAAATTGVWSIAGNWSAGGVPTSGEMGGTVVQIGGGVTATDNIAGLVIDRFVFTNGGNTVAGSGVTLTINTPVFGTNLENVTGSNTIASSLPVVFSGGALCGVIVDAGTLTLASNVSGEGFILQAPSAPGTLMLTGSNSFGPVTIREGAVLLGSSTANVAMPSNVTIGNGIGGPSSAVLASTLAEQIADGASLTILSDGRLDLSFGETIASLNMTGGLVASVTGMGSLAVGAGGVTATSDSIPLPASISVNMTLTSIPTPFTVNPGLGGIQLDVSGALGGPGGLTKSGAGTLQLSGSQSNSHGFGTIVGAGTLLLNKTPGVNAVGAQFVIGDVSGTGAQTV
ncbi:MAG TPA: hypothetical protein VGR00_10940, partial [Thermoanaerobaculia bacterium]|nr:hypothetical protein [Thermoanaerobaculia bacterium]